MARPHEYQVRIVSGHRVVRYFTATLDKALNDVGSLLIWTADHPLSSSNSIYMTVEHEGSVVVEVKHG